MTKTFTLVPEYEKQISELKATVTGLVASLTHWHYQVHGLEFDFEKCKDPRCMAAVLAKAKAIE